MVTGKSGFSGHFGGSFLGDILTAFTDFSPRKDPHKVGRGAEGAPVVAAFSPPKSSVQKSHYLRKYLLHSTHRSRASNCPSSPSIESPSPKKSLAYAIQQGTICQYSSITSTNSSPTGRTGERSPSKNAPRRSESERRTHYSPQKPKVLIPVLNANSQAGLKEFDHHRMEPLGQQQDGDPFDTSSSLPKMPFKQKTLEEICSDEQKTRTACIWKLHLEGSKNDRMARLSNSRKMKDNEQLHSSRDKVSAREEIELAEESYFRYFKQSKKYERERILDALRDFGIRARSQPEKSGLFKTLEEYAEKGEITFRDFCVIIEETRTKTRACRFSSVFAVWRQLDLEDIGGLDAHQAMKLLHMLNIGPTNPVDVAVVEARIERLRKDAMGLYSLGEIEYLVQECREYIESSRSRAEHQLQMTYNLKERIFSEFRSQLTELHDQFKRLDENNNGWLTMDETMFLLADFGIITQYTHAEKKGIQKDLVSLLGRIGSKSGNKDVKNINFHEFLSCVRLLRKRLIDHYIDTVCTLFLIYDRDRSGELETKEICAVIQDLELLPRTLAEQDAIAELLEESDVDGSGSLQFDEVLLMIVRIFERINMLQRTVENAKAESLNFTRHQCYDLRRCFETLDFDNSGALTYSEVTRAIHMMQWRASEAKIHQLFCEFDADDTGSISFIEFANLMYRLDQDVTAVTLDDRAVNEADQQKTMDTHGTKQEEQTGKTMTKTFRRNRHHSNTGTGGTGIRKQVTRGALGV